MAAADKQLLFFFHSLFCIKCSLAPLFLQLPLPLSYHKHLESEASSFGGKTNVGQ